jgi:tryptophan 2,3-dioxygenase
MKEPLSYASYLKLPELLSLQQPQAKPVHLDEMQFIIVHQAFELWFKLVLHDLDDVFPALEKGSLREATLLIRRITQIERLWLEQIHILETMGPEDFLRFRSILTPASGFQSVQFREIEFASGLKDPRFLQLFAKDPDAVQRLQQRLKAPSLWDAFLAVLAHAGLDTGERRPQTLKTLYTDPSRLALRDLAEALIEYDEYLALWRAHHIHMVARMIGGKPGTGYALVQGTLKGGEPMGSQGVDYLQATLSKKCFPELWEVRTLL